MNEMKSLVTSDLIFAIYISSSSCHTNCQTNKYSLSAKLLIVRPVLSKHLWESQKLVA